MKFTTRAVFLGSVAVALLCAIGLFAQTHKSIHLNEDAFAFARQHIKDGHVIPDGKGMWRKDRPSADEENQFIRLHGFTEYAKWHLGIDERHGENTKARYKFPYGDFNNVHRCGLLAVKTRARQYGYTQIESAATELEAGIKSVGAPPHSNTHARNGGLQKRPRFGVRQYFAAFGSSSRKGIVP